MNRAVAEQLRGWFCSSSSSGRLTLNNCFFFLLFLDCLVFLEDELFGREISLCCVLPTMESEPTHCL